MSFWNPFKRKRKTNCKEQTQVMLEMLFYARTHPECTVRTTKATRKNSNLKRFVSWNWVGSLNKRGRSFKIGDDIFVFSTKG